MIKNIYIQYGTLACLYPSAYFCNTHSAHLQEHGFYFPHIYDILPHSKASDEADLFNLSTHEWLHNYMHQLFSKNNEKQALSAGVEPIFFPSRLQCLENLYSALEKKEDIHSLCFFINSTPSSPEDNISIIEDIQKVFPEAKLHFSFQILPADKEILGRWLQISYYIKEQNRDDYITFAAKQDSFLYKVQKIAKSLSKHFEINRDIHILENDKESFNDWKNWLNLTLPEDFKKESLPSIFISNKKLKFIQSVEKKNYPQAHYLTWLLENDFMLSSLAENDSYDFFLKSQKEFINQQFDYISRNVPLEPIDAVKSVYSTSNYINENTILEFDEALFFVSKLSASFRKKLLSQINISDIYNCEPHQLNTKIAVLVFENIINKQEADKILKNKIKTNIQDIYIHFSPLASRIKLIDYSLKNKEKLEKEGFYYPLYSDISQNFPDELNFFDSIGNSWLYENKAKYQTRLNAETRDNAFNFNTSSEPFKELHKYLADKKELSSLILFMPIELTYADTALFYKKIKEYFSNAKIHIQVCTLSPQRTIESHWLEFMFSCIELYSLQAYMWAVNQKSSYIYNYFMLSEVLKGKYGNNFELNHLGDENKVLDIWQNWLKCDFTSFAESENINIIASSEVLAFIRAVQKSDYADGLYYNWYNQSEFLSYNYDENQLNTYLRPYWHTDIQNRFDKYSPLPYECKEIKYNDLSDASLAISSEIAFELAQLLSSELRKKIIERVEIATLHYKAQSTRNVYAALLFLEGKIDKAQLAEFTKQAQGILLPPTLIEGKIETAKPKVAVLTMTYNHVKYIEQCIRSVLAQKTDFPVTHIIVDDASTDGTKEILLKYAKIYPHIKLILNSKNAPHDQFTKLADQISAPYVALCDGDDYFLDSEKLQKQVDYMEANKRAALCFHHVLTIFEDEPERKQIYPDPKSMRNIKDKYYFSELLLDNLIQTNSVLYRWRFKDKGLPAWFAHATCPSDRYWHLIHAEVGYGAFLQEIMTVYRRHKQGQFYQTEVDLMKHRDLYGIQEVLLYEFLDIHFEKKFNTAIQEMIHVVYNERVINATKSQDFSYLKNMMEYFPNFISYITK